jgi:hypothetical protein
MRARGWPRAILVLINGDDADDEVPDTPHAMQHDNDDG